MKQKSLRLYWSVFSVTMALFMAAIIIIIYYSTVLNSETISSSPSSECKVVLSESGFFNSESYVKTAQKGSSVTFNLSFEEGYAFEGTDYSDYQVNETDDDVVVLTLNNIRYPVSVEVYAKLDTPNPDNPNPDNPNPNNPNPNNPNPDNPNPDNPNPDNPNPDNPNPDNPNPDNPNPDNPNPDNPNPPAGGLTVNYHLNGGSMLDGSEGNFYTVVEEEHIYPRVNTSLGADTIEREGYVLYGWNTQADGSGTHVGLGSRYTVQPGEVGNLYAQWSEWTDGNYFEYVLIDTEDVPSLYAGGAARRTLEQLIASQDSTDVSAVITAYTGAQLEVITVPEELDGYSVAVIASNAFDAENDIETVVLPKSIRYLCATAFNECTALKELYVYDNISRCNKTAFGETFPLETMHINAILPPVFGESENGQIANKMEMLINSNPNEKKIVLFGGCSLWYALDSSRIDRTFNYEYEVYNMGVIGGTCATFQMDLILEYMNEGDVFIHMPELASIYQLLGDVNLDERAFSSMENNYDLLASLNLQNYGSVLNSFDQYLASRNTRYEYGDFSNAQYVYRLDTVNSYGDMVRPRSGNFDNEGIPYEIETVENFEESNAAQTMLEYYGKFNQKGISVLFGFGPINGDGFDQEKGEALVLRIQDTIDELSIPIRTFMNLSDCVMEKRYFYDTNYHLSTEGVEIFSALVASSLSSYIN